MSQFDRPGLTLAERERRRSAGPRFGIGDRIARTFGGFDRTREDLPTWESGEDLEYPIEDERTEAWDSVSARFPVARHGYEQSAVDEHIASLERELEELRTHGSGAVAAELEKVGEQTSAILLLAHDKAREITRSAQEQADRCLADAASNAVALTESAKQKLRRLDAETESIWDERARLLDDARGLAHAMTALVEEAGRRFPAETEKATVAVPPLSADPAPELTDEPLSVGPVPGPTDEPVGAEDHPDDVEQPTAAYEPPSEPYGDGGVYRAGYGWQPYGE